MPKKEEGKDLFYTKLYEKCSSKLKDTGEFEECCEKEAGNVPKNSFIDKAEKIIDKVIDKVIDKSLDKTKEFIDNGK